MSHTVVGIFEFNVLAQKAKDYLITQGFNSQDIDINTSGVAANDELAGTSDGKLPVTSEETVNYAMHPEQEDDSVSGFFKHLFGHHDDQDQNEETLQQHIQASRRGVVVTVHAKSDQQAEIAADILDSHGAVDVDEFAQRTPENHAQATTPAATASKIQVIEETLKVGKREVETGGVRLRSRIVSRPVEESIRLREEHVTVERNPVNRVATEADFAAFKEGTVELTEHAEKAIVAKEARIVEEVSLNKETSEKEEVVKETVRHTEVDTEQLAPKESTLTNKQTDTSKGL